MKTATITAGLLAVACVVSASDKADFSKLDLNRLPAAAEAKGLTYVKDIRPILEASCFRCHGDERAKGGLKLNSLSAVLKGGEDGKIVVPGDSKKSLLVIATAQLDNETAMPPKRGRGGRGPGGRPPGAPGDEGAAQKPSQGSDG